MKKQNLIVGLALAVAIGGIISFQSCTRIGKLLNFNLGMQTESVNVTIPATAANGLITIGPATTYFNVDSFVKAQTGNQLGASNITSVKLASVVFTLNNATPFNNFQNFESCSAAFTSNTNSTPYTVSIPSNPDVFANTLVLPVDSTTELKSYIGNQLNYTVSGKLRRPTTDSLNCTVTFKFSVAVQG